MTPSDTQACELAELTRLRRAKDLMDREYDQPLDVPRMAQEAFMSPAHFARQFKLAYGETPYGYLMTRRIERAMALLRRGDLPPSSPLRSEQGGAPSVTEVCMTVGCTSLGSFSSRFTELVGETPSAYRSRAHVDTGLPACIDKEANRAGIKKRPAGA